MSTELLDNGAERYRTEGGVTVTRQRHETPYVGAIETYVDALNSRRGCVFSSNYEYPGRYTRWDTAIVDPPLVVSARGRDMRIEALNARGEKLLDGIAPVVEALAEVTEFVRAPAARHAHRRRTRPNLRRGRTQPRSHGLFRPARHRLAVQVAGRRQSRPLRRLRLRSRLPVRPRHLEARPAAKPARRRALPSRRNPRRRPSSGESLA